jgi:hypothetical protein
VSKGYSQYKYGIGLAYHAFRETDYCESCKPPEYTEYVKNKIWYQNSLQESTKLIHEIHIQPNA